MGEGLLNNNIRLKRVVRSLTQEELATMAGVTRQTIIAMEKGNYIPSVLLALRLAKALECSVEDLFNETTP